MMRAAINPREDATYSASESPTPTARRILEAMFGKPEEARPSPDQVANCFQALFERYGLQPSSEAAWLLLLRFAVERKELGFRDFPFETKLEAGRPASSAMVHLLIDVRMEGYLFAHDLNGVRVGEKQMTVADAARRTFEQLSAEGFIGADGREIQDADSVRTIWYARQQGAAQPGKLKKAMEPELHRKWLRNLVAAVSVKFGARPGS